MTPRPASPHDSAASPPPASASKNRSAAESTPTSKDASTAAASGKRSTLMTTPTTLTANGKGSSTTAVVLKPKLRGRLHLFSAFSAAAAGASMVASASRISAQAGWATLIYTFSLVALLATSATYHVPNWSQAARDRLKRADHAAIYLLIAGTYAPLCLLAPLPAGAGARLLSRVAAGAGAGVAQSLLWPKAPRPVAVALYVALGWAAAPDARALAAALPPLAGPLILAGGVCYTVGALCYAARWPDPAPSTFGYHEIFHAATILASVAHFAAVHIVAHESPSPP